MSDLAVWRRRAVERARAARRGHPGALLARGVRIGGPGTVRLGRLARLGEDVRIHVGPGAVLELGPGARIGDRTVVNVRARITIGADSEVSWQCQLLDTDFHQLVRPDGSTGPVVSPVLIGQHVLIGTGVIVVKGVTVGDGAVIGAGSVLTTDVEPDTVVAGNPARVVGRISDWRPPPRGTR